MTLLTVQGIPGLLSLRTGREASGQSGDMDDSIAIQRDAIRRMNQAHSDPITLQPVNWHNRPGTKGGIRCLLWCSDTYLCDDPATGRPLSLGQFFDLHAMTMMIVGEIEGRPAQEPKCNGCQAGHGPGWQRHWSRIGSYRDLCPDCVAHERATGRSRFSVKIEPTPTKDTP